MAKQIAIKRLLADLKEVLEHPQVDAVARPLEDNLFVWHANLRGCEEEGAAAAGPLGAVPIHAVLVFPDTYPTDGPEVRLFHGLPHPNVAPHQAPPEEAYCAAYRVSLWDCNPSIDQWSPGYSVSSILAVLHCLLLDPDLLYATDKISYKRAQQAALQLELTGHPHRGSAPSPAFPTPEEVALAPRLRQINMKRPPVNKELMTALPDLAPGAGKASLVDSEGWREVGDKGIRPRQSLTSQLQAGSTPASSTAGQPASSLAGGGYALLAALDEAGQVAVDGDSAAEATAASPGQGLASPASSVASAAHAASPAAAALAPATSSGASSSRRKRLLDDSILRSSQRSLVADVMALYRRRQAGVLAERAQRRAVHADSIVGAADHREAAAEHASAGPLFDLLTPDALAQILLRMEARDVAALGATCRSLRASAADGEVWRAQLRGSFPRSSLVCADLADYRLAFQLEANGVVPELSCFYSRAQFDGEVLGYACQYTVNPRTGAVDYCMPTSPDLVSVEAVQAGMVRRDTNGSEVQGAIPAYITAEHFERAQAVLPSVLRQLCPREHRPGPEAWLSVLPTMLNTCVVLLSDHGLAASERALNTYCGLHRLLLALCDRHSMWERVDRRVGRFVTQPAQRVKSEAPSLGHMVPLLALSRRHDWSDVLPVILSEAMDRQVLWACKADRSLITRYSVDPERGGVDRKLMEGVFQTSRVSFRLYMFHAAFLSLVARPQGQPLGEVMYRLDCLYGRPGAGLQRRFQALVGRILECKGLNEALELMGVVPLSDEAWTRRLRQAWLNSLAKGYHTRRTNWDRIQAGGVSRLLLKGQQYSTPPNLSVIEVDERWRSCGRFGGFTYLDASCLIYGRRRGAAPTAPLERLDVVDYSNTRSHDCKGSVTHSGDVIDGDSGQHTMRINLGTLPDTVEALFLTMSTFAGAKLKDIEQPFICVRDPASGVELCGFQLDDVPSAQRATHSSVVMLKVSRGVIQGRWEIQAVGQVGHGDASNYVPLQSWIQGSLNSRPAEQRRR